MAQLGRKDVNALKALAMAAAVAGFMTAPVAANAADTYKFKMATGWAGGPLMDIGAKAFAERIDQLSDGRIKVQVFPGGALGNALKVSETVKNGVAELGHTWMGYDWGRDPSVVLFGGYAGSFDSERMLHWLYEGGGAELQRHGKRCSASSPCRCSSARRRCSCTRASPSARWTT